MKVTKSVKVHKRVLDREAKEYKIEFDYFAEFHQLSRESYEGEIYPVAIVQKGDGFLATVPVELVQFV